MSSSGRSASLGGVESQTESAVEREAEDANSKPSYVEWEAREMATRTTTGDRTTVAGVGRTSSLHYYYLAFVVLTHY
jgi:hypothetical protein